MQESINTKKQLERAALNADIEAFMTSGGSITVIEKPAPSDAKKNDHRKTDEKW